MTSAKIYPNVYISSEQSKSQPKVKLLVNRTMFAALALTSLAVSAIANPLVSLDSDGLFKRANSSCSSSGPVVCWFTRDLSLILNFQANCMIMSVLPQHHLRERYLLLRDTGRSPAPDPILGHRPSSECYDFMHHLSD